MIYDLSAPHSLLTGKSIALLESNEEQFNGQVEMAEVYLGLTTLPKYTGAQANQIKNFLALQVNWQLEIGITPLYTKSELSQHTSQSTTYRDNLIIHPGVALGLKTLIRSWGFPSTVRRVRG